MSPGRREGQGQDKQERLMQWRLGVRAEFERLSSLPLTDLAAEVMVRGFGPGAPGSSQAADAGPASLPARASAMIISYELVPEKGFSFPAPSAEDDALRDQLALLVAEGLQQLEHASLVCCQGYRAQSFQWTATRLGRAALERGDVPQMLQAASRAPES